MTIRKLLYKYISTHNADLTIADREIKRIQDEFSVPERYRKSLYDIIREEGL